MLLLLNEISDMEAMLEALTLNPTDKEILLYLADNPALLRINNITEPKDLKEKIMASWDEEDTDDGWEDYILDYLEDEAPGLRTEWLNMVRIYIKAKLSNSML